VRPPTGEAERAARSRRTRAVLSWAALAVLLVAFVARPHQRAGLATMVQLGYLLVIWFFLARTKTLAWQTLAVLFTAGLPWALVVGLGTGRLAGDPEAFGSATVLAALAEIALALLPLLLIAVARPARVQRLAVVDWLLAGFALGLSFQAVESLARNGFADFGLSPISGGAAVGTSAGFAGRHTLVAVVAVSVGFAVAGWRHAERPTLSPAGRIGWRTTALVAPVLAWWLAVSVQAGYNATALVGERWLTGADPQLPLAIRLGWRVGNHGFGVGWLLLLLLMVALLVDAGRLRNAAELAEDPLPYPFDPTQTADRWAGRFTRWAGTRTALPIAAVVWLIAAGCAAIAYAVRDFLVVLVAFAIDPQPATPPEPRPADAPGEEAGESPSTRLRIRAARRESRWSAIARGRAAGVMVRAIRAEAISAAAGPATRPSRRAIRLYAGAGLAGLLAAALWLGPQWAGEIGDGVAATGAPTAWLAGALDRIGPWWSGLALWELVLLGLGALALLVITAGPLDLWSGTISNSTFLGDRMSGAPDLGRDPAGLARAFLLTSTPADVAVDAVGAGLTFVPGTVGGPATGLNVRFAVRDFVGDPDRFVAARRAAARQAALHPTAADDTAPIKIRTHPDLPAIKLADGRLVAALSDDDERLFISTLDDLIRGNIRSRNEAAEYQVRIYGDDERLISQRPEKWSDGHNTAYGTVADAVYYDGRGPSSYAPETLPESIRHKAYLEMDRRLIEYATAVYYPASPFRALEVTTNHPVVAQALEERMARLAIPGYVVLEP
jgi:hypothetical protein